MLHEELINLPLVTEKITFNEVDILREPLSIHDIEEKADRDSLLRDNDDLNIDTLPYHEKRDELFSKIDYLYRELTPDHGREFIAKVMPHRTKEQIRLMDIAYRDTIPHEGKMLLAKMCPPNV